MKFIKVLLDWLFVPHGYLNNYKDTPLIGKQMDTATMALAYKFKGKPKFNTCKVCGVKFYAIKKLPTCQRIKCFFSYRLNN